MSDQTDNSQKELIEDQELSNQLPEEITDQADRAKRELAEIQELLK